MRHPILSLAALLLTLEIALCLPARAAIDNGVSGDGDLFFNIWDCTRSYSRDLGISINAFETRLGETGSLVLSWPADENLVRFMAGVIQAGDLHWNIVAVDTVGARRVLTTYTPPKTQTPIDADTGRRLAGTIQARIIEINLGLNGAGNYLDPSDDAQSALFRACETGFTGNDMTFGRQLSGKLGFDSTGTLANASPATGLGFMRLDIAPFGLKPAVLHEYADGQLPVRAWIDGDYGLHMGAAESTLGAAESR